MRTGELNHGPHRSPPAANPPRPPRRTQRSENIYDVDNSVFVKSNENILASTIDPVASENLETVDGQVVILHRGNDDHDSIQPDESSVAPAIEMNSSSRSLDGHHVYAKVNKNRPSERQHASLNGQ